MSLCSSGNTLWIYSETVAIEFQESVASCSKCVHNTVGPVLRILYRAICQSFCHQRALLATEKKFPQHRTKKCKIICQGGVLKVWYKLQVQWKIRTGKAVRAMRLVGRGKVGFGMHAGQAINKHLLQASSPRSAFYLLCLPTPKLTAPGEHTEISWISLPRRL